MKPWPLVVVLACLLPAQEAGAVTLKAGDLLVADASAPSCGVFVVDPVTGAQTSLGPATLFSGAFGIALSKQGEVFVAARSVSGGTPGVFRIDPETGAQSAVATGLPFRSPVGLALDSTGGLLVADPGAHTLLRVNLSTGDVAMFNTYLPNPTGVAVGADGNVYVVDPVGADGRGNVIRIDPASGTQFAISQDGSFTDPIGIAVESDGMLLVTDETASDGFGALFRVSPESGVQTPVSAAGQFVDPFGVAVAENGTVFIADVGAGTGGSVFHVSPSSGAQTLVSTGGNFINPLAIVVVSSRVTPTLRITWGALKRRYAR